MTHNFAFFPRLWLGVLLVGVLTACGETREQTPPSTDEDFCEDHPCDAQCVDQETRCSSACADLETQCSAACAEFVDVDAICQEPACDPLCDPCDPACDACDANCDVSHVGPPLDPIACDATLLEAGDDTTPAIWEVAFEVPSDVPAWLLSVWDPDDQDLHALEWTLPSATVLDLETWEKFGEHQQQISPKLVTILHPIAPKYEDLLESGTHRITFALEGGSAPCWRWTPQLPHAETLPYRLRLDLTAVGTEFVDSDTMREDPLLREALVYAQEQFALADIDLHVEGWDVADEALSAAYGELEGSAQARELLGQLPAMDEGDAVASLRIPTAMVDRFSVESGLLGLAGGLPGPVGLHGQESGGVVISLSLLSAYRGPEQVGMMLVHELGHYLGLRHTSSWPHFGPDPLDDTPECPQSVYQSNSYDCEDAYNVMFPLLSMAEDHWWSDEQVEVIQGHPAVTQRTP